MPRNHAAIVLCLWLAAPLAGCVGARLAAAPAAGASISGAWKLNHVTSDDPQKVIDHMRAEAARRIARQAQQAPVQRPGMRGGDAAADILADTQDSTPPTGHRPDPLRNSQMYRVLTDALARGDFLTVRGAAGEVVFDYGTSVRSFTPGGHSVVSAEGGVGDQTSGWDGRDYVINIKAQMGPDVSERYSLSADGKHLIEKLRIGPAELPVVDLTRVYDPTSETAPRRLPTND
jgi:hypothetical protein